MSYTKKQFIEDVKKEARALRENATPAELDNIDIKKFDPEHQRRCIYGLATGNCRSERAIELIETCCPRFVSSEALYKISVAKYDGEREAFSIVRDFVNGVKWEGDKASLKYVSTIEAYIYLPEAQNANLIAYLKGETNDLVL
jgi:hypothetical protein